MKKSEDMKPRPTGKLPYEPPAVVSEEVFETMALTCLKGTGGEAGCGPGKS